jgi:tetratricopeptide (TPR) repeat protein
MAAVTVEQALEFAITQHQAGRLAEAEAIYRQILAVQPDHAEALHLLGLIALALGRFDAASELIGKAITQSAQPVYYSNLGEVYRRAGRLQEAITYFHHALALDPASANTHLNLGAALIRVGQLDEAIVSSRRALALQADLPDAHLNLGVALANTGRLDEAIESYQRALALRPDFAEVHNNLGSALADKGQLEDASTCYQRALAISPEHAETNNNLGNAFLEVDQWSEAIACFRRALDARPQYAEAYSNLGVALRGARQFTEALLSFRQAIICDPNFAAAHWNLASTLLLLGRYEEGWKEYEWRWSGLSIPRRIFSAPQWDGAPLLDQTLLIHAEQGFGDTIQFVRYLPFVRERLGAAARVIFECPLRLKRLLTGTNDWASEIVYRQIGDDRALPPFDLHLPLLSLPLALQRFTPLPTKAPYLHADSELCAIWRNRLGSDSTFRVGVAWAGNRTHKDDRRRSIDPQEFMPILGVPGVAFYSLQIETWNTGQSSPPAEFIDFTAHVTDFADTAAFIAELDLIISVDTATAHLAGALGRPVWTLLPFVPDWRWGLEGEDTPWYPTMRLFRQRTAGDWEEVVNRVADALVIARG